MKKFISILTIFFIFTSTSVYADVKGKALDELSSKISETLYNMRLEFIKTYLNETSDFVPSNAAIPSDKRDILKKEVKHDGVDYFTGNLVFEEGDENIIPLDWAWKIKW